jgi:hypothetical protein
LHCTHCGRNNHKIEDCYHASKPKCTVCKKLGHKEEECTFKKKTQKPHKSKDKKIAESSALKKETHIVENRSDNETLAAIGDNHFIITDDPLIDDVFDYNVQYGNLAANSSDCMYDWLADTRSTNHISNRHKNFSSYEPTPEATVHGVSGKIIQVVGCGTVILTAQYGTQKRTLCLENVNYIPSNKYNIFALSRWDNQGW